MSRRLILHIGHHKTGTTSLQNTLFANRSRLQQFGFDYFAMQANHSLSMVRLCQARPGDTAAQSDHYRKTIWSALEPQLNDSRFNLIICAEGLSTLSAGGIHNLNEKLSPYFDDIFVIGYVRPPRSLLNSWAQQRLKRGFTLEEMPSGRAPSPRYRNMFSLWLDTFGSNRVRLKLFHREALNEKSLLSDFASEIGLPPEFSSGITEEIANPSLSLECGNLLAALNAVMLNRNMSQPVREKISKYVRSSLPEKNGPPYRVPHWLEKQILDDCREQIAWMENHLGIDLASFDDPENTTQNSFNHQTLEPELQLAIRTLIFLAQSSLKKE